jgi:hypothetical protein
MYEHILAGLALDESETFARIEPLYCSLFSHNLLLSFSEGYLCFSDRLQSLKSRTLNSAAC